MSWACVCVCAYLCVCLYVHYAKTIIANAQHERNQAITVRLFGSIGVSLNRAMCRFGGPETNLEHFHCDRINCDGNPNNLSVRHARNHPLPFSLHTPNVCAYTFFPALSIALYCCCCLGCIHVSLSLTHSLFVPLFFASVLLVVYFVCLCSAALVCRNKLRA